MRLARTGNKTEISHQKYTLMYKDGEIKKEI